MVRTSQEAVAFGRKFAPLSDDAQGLLASAVSPVAGVARLLAKQRIRDALGFTAFALPLSDAVWWGCLCAWDEARPLPPPLEATALRTVLRWLQKPGEPTRHATEQAALQAGLQTPAGCLAQAVFHGTGNISRPGLPAVVPPPELACRLILTGLRLAAQRHRSRSPEECFRLYLRLAQPALERVSALAAPAPAPAATNLASQWGDEPD
jgi:hypothetical protein